MNSVLYPKIKVVVLENRNQDRKGAPGRSFLLLNVEFTSCAHVAVILFSCARNLTFVPSTPLKAARYCRKQVGEAEWEINKSLSVWRSRSNIPAGWAKSFQNNNRDIYMCILAVAQFECLAKTFLPSFFRIGHKCLKGKSWYFTNCQ